MYPNPGVPFSHGLYMDTKHGFVVGPSNQDLKAPGNSSIK